MTLKFKNLAGVLFVIASISVFPSAATAQSASTTNSSSFESPADLMNRAVFKNTPNFFRDQGFGGQINTIFGVGSPVNTYPENRDRRDAELVDRIYQDALKQQNTSGSILRTQDLPNPYASSIIESTNSYPDPGFETLPLH